MSDVYFLIIKILRFHCPHITAVIKLIHLQITDTTHRHTLVPSAARSTDCVDIASGSVLLVAQWTWYVYAVWGSGQTGRTSGKCSFMISFMFSTVHKMLLSLPNEGKRDG